MNGAIHEDADRVRAFFDEWSLYRKVLDLDCLDHRGAYAAVAASLGKIGHPFSFLDLGAGDAECSISVLEGRPLTRYEAVDLSAAALAKAKCRATALGCETAFVQANFVDHVAACESRFDVVLTGLSLHHLPQADKRRFLPQVRRILARGGSLLIYEPVQMATETREALMGRWWEDVQRRWKGLSEGELAAVRKHVFENDYTEAISKYGEMFAEAGFAGSEVLYESTGGFYALMEAKA